MGAVVKVMLAKSLIACILIREKLRGCKAIDFTLDLHCFSSYNLVCVFEWDMAKNTHTCTHSQTEAHQDE